MKSQSNCPRLPRRPGRTRGLRGSQRNRQIERVRRSAPSRPLHGCAHQLGRVAEIEFLLDVRAMGFNRAEAEVKFLSDLARGAALTHQLEDLELTIAETGNAGLISRQLAADQGVEHAPPNAFADVHLAT